MQDASRWEEQAGLALLRLSALEAAGGVSAFFTGRSGGASARWDGGLNWSHAVGDLPQNVRANRRRTLATLGLAPGQAVMAGLVHGDRVVAVRASDVAAASAAAGVSGQEGISDDVGLVDHCDGLITDVPGLALVITAADCVPIYLFDPDRPAIGVVHAGWRGTVLGIAGKAVAAMVEHYGSDPARIHAAIGPSIGPCCYEVDHRVVGPVDQQFGLQAQALYRSAGAPGKFLLDLWAANRLDLSRAGVRSISLSGQCTACGTDRLFSHRGEAGLAGRGAAVIAMR